MMTVLKVRTQIFKLLKLGMLHMQLGDLYYIGGGKYTVHFKLLK